MAERSAVSSAETGRPPPGAGGQVRDELTAPRATRDKHAHRDTEEPEQIMTQPTSQSSARAWLPFGEVQPSQPRLYCFPNAGAGAASFATWRRLAPSGVAVCPVQLPGRAERFRESPYDRVDPLVNELVSVLGDQFSGPYVLFGHSLGALVAFETVHRLRAIGGQQPVHLFVSGREAPHLPNNRKLLANLPTDELLAELRHMGGTPDEVLRDKELMAALLPLLRADAAVNEVYHYRHTVPLDIPLTVFGGYRDSRADEDHLRAWESLTSASFDIRMFPGGHFFINEYAQELLNIMVRPMAAALTDTPSSNRGGHGNIPL
jgi:medium-chain acyl-[acyl-carrier-protein] hydrolase